MSSSRSLEDIADEYAEDVQEEAIDQLLLSEISEKRESFGQMCLEVLDLLESKDRLERELKEISAKLRVYQEVLIPTQMEERNEKKIETAGGLKIELENFIVGGLPKDQERQRDIFDYVRKTGNAELIKTAYQIQFGTHTDEHALEFERLLEESQTGQYAMVKKSRTIHSSSYMKFLRDQLKAGASFDLRKFGAHSKSIATIQLKKRR